MMEILNPLKVKKMKMTKALSLLAGLVSLFCTTNSFSAGSVSGPLNVTLTIGSGCVVTGGSNSGSVNDFGTLDFGTHPSLVDAIIGQSAAAGGGNIQITCTAGVPYYITLNQGVNATGIQRNMTNGTTPIMYNLYQDNLHLNSWVPNISYPSPNPTGAATNFIVYGQVPSVTGTQPAAGIYNDTVTVTVSW